MSDSKTFGEEVRNSALGSTFGLVEDDVVRFDRPPQWESSSFRRPLSLPQVSALESTAVAFHDELLLNLIFRHLAVCAANVTPGRRTSSKGSSSSPHAFQLTFDVREHVESTWRPKNGTNTQ